MTSGSVDGADVVEIDRHAALIDGDDRAGRRRQRRGDGVARQVAGDRVDVGEDGVRADVADGVRRRDERERRDDDVVTRTDPRDDEREMQRGGAARRRDGERAPASPSANSCSKRATRGPCATQPLAITSATASASSWPSQGTITLMRSLIARSPLRPAAISSRSGAPPVDELPQTLVEPDRRLEAEVALGGATCRRAAGRRR